jgi:hypothetical protein
MTSARNGSTNGYVGHGKARRFRIDGNDRQSPPPSGPVHNGRLVVIAGVISVLALWGILGVVFRDWRAQHEQLASYGARNVATLVDPLKDLNPPEMDRGQWVEAVDKTHELLVLLTGSGLFDRQSIQQFHDDVGRRVAGATSDTAQSTLATLWDEMEHKAGPVLLRKTHDPEHPILRPKILGPSDPRLTSRMIRTGP